ncbi:MAG TPA: polysaccharide deacetylase family protein [Pseudonocardia sp.]|nr:polysaccharide deacetylase family protein [Pseudonocardia sp.]
MTLSPPTPSTGHASSAWVWMHHSVADYERDPYQITVTPSTFQRQLTWLRRRGLRGVSVVELLTGPGGRELVGLTFDDGYADFMTTVVPALHRFGFTATVYVLAGRLGGSNSWDADAPHKALMTGEQVRAAAGAGMEIGSHGLRHLHLPELRPDQLADEVGRSRELLREVSGQEVAGFAYPYGDAGEREFEAVREAGYTHASHVGHPTPVTAFSIPRTFVGERDRGARLTAKRVRHELRRRSSR